MAYLQKRQTKGGATAYIVKWKAADGKHRTKGGFRTKKDAQAYATDVEHSLRRGLEFDPKSGGILFRDAAQLWLTSRADLKATTLAEHRCALAPAAKRRGDGKTIGIDAVFGSYPLNAVKREHISAWVAQLAEAGKKPPTIRYQYFLVRMILAQAVADGRLAANPADYVKLPGESGTRAVVDDPAQFLSATQVTALVAATPWPYNVLVHTACWSGLRAAELGGLQIGDLDLPAPSLNPNAPAKPGAVRVERTARPLGGAMTYLEPKTKGSRRRVPLTAHTTTLLRDYLTEHPRADDPTAPLFPEMRLYPTSNDLDALAELSVGEAEARMVLDWESLLRHGPLYQLVFRPAVLRANRLTPTAKLSSRTKFHSCRHTYASLCIAAGIPPMHLSRFMGHTSLSITLGVYAHLFADDHADSMAALGALGTTYTAASETSGNVVPLRAKAVGTR
jgi:integrase